MTAGKRGRKTGKRAAAALLAICNIAFAAGVCGLLSMAAVAAQAAPPADDVFYPVRYTSELEPEQAAEIPQAQGAPAGEEPPAEAASAAPPDAGQMPEESSTVKTLAAASNKPGYGDKWLIQINNRSTLSPDFTALLARPPALKEYQEGQPEVLVVHTHTSESYLGDGVIDYPENYGGRSQDPEKTVAAVGRAFADTLAANGIAALHDATVNDYPEYTGAYGRSAWVISEYLKKYPSIRCVIDLHRDAITAADGRKYKLLVPEARDTAQVMIVSGCYKGGLSHPYYEENLRLAMLWQEQMNSGGMTLSKPVDFVKYRYNQQLTTGSLILEVGTDANTLPEAKRGAEKAAAALAKVLKRLR